MALWKGSSGSQIFKKEENFSVPLISVGNLVVGGSGKTPVALSLGKLLRDKGHHVHFVTRGYKGSVKGPLKVNPNVHKAKEVGDEPLLLSSLAPTWIAKKRVLGVQKAIESGATLIILDDGHQTGGLKKTVSLLVFDFLQKFGNNYVLPAGPLRENLSQGLKRAHALIGVGEGDFSPSKPLFKAQVVPHSFQCSSRKIFAFCGLGYPQKFYKTLEKKGRELVGTRSFPDHHHYTDKELHHLEYTAQTLEAVLVTTRKDWVKLSPSWQKKIYCFDIDIVFSNPEKLYTFIEEKIAQESSS